MPTQIRTKFKKTVSQLFESEIKGHNIPLTPYHPNIPQAFLGLEFLTLVQSIPTSTPKRGSQSLSPIVSISLFPNLGGTFGGKFDRNVCNLLANKGIRVIVAGLDMDYKGKPFGPMPNLMATAEFVTKVHAICTKTGGLAQYSHRKTSDENLVLLGETNEYEPLSRQSYYKINQDQLNELKANSYEKLKNNDKNVK